MSTVYSSGIRRRVRSSPARQKIEQAIETLVQEGKPFNLTSVVQTAGVSSPTLYNHPDLLEKAKQAGGIRRRIRKSEARQRIEKVIESLVQEGKPFNLTNVVQTAEVTPKTLYRHPDLLEKARQAVVVTKAKQELGTVRSCNRDPPLLVS